MKYKGYTAKVEYDAEAGLLHGELEDISDVVTFQADSVAELEAEFHAAVDDYLDFCKEEGREPNRPFSGKLVLRMNPDLHRAASRTARSEKQSLNAFISSAVEAAVRKGSAPLDT
ncbi:MAG TPA: type II toxin-antitoxin system HicB family antitoxin [Longimicrobium sp.]|jgi:predicted HicB family RNase H-like nuclease|uniref:type II toxin-antitoxin system HicB family antitoxin n=1 Tax=Longimicrobium sp. TaxID=2029185 RepID=UPI002EDB7A7B